LRFRDLFILPAYVLLALLAVDILNHM
jgi:hypothetical protein